MQRSKAEGVGRASRGFDCAFVTRAVTPGVKCGPAGVKGEETRHFRAVDLLSLTRGCGLLRCGNWRRQAWRPGDRGDAGVLDGGKKSCGEVAPGAAQKKSPAPGAWGAIKRGAQIWMKILVPHVLHKSG